MTGTLLWIAFWVLLVGVIPFLLYLAIRRGIGTIDDPERKLLRLHLRRSGTHARDRGDTWEPEPLAPPPPDCAVQGCLLKDNHGGLCFDGAELFSPDDYLPATMLIDEPLHDDTLWHGTPPVMPPPIPQPVSDTAVIWEDEPEPHSRAARFLRFHYDRAVYEAELRGTVVEGHGRVWQLRVQTIAVGLLRRELRQARTAARHPELMVSDYPEWATGEMAAVVAEMGADK